MLPFFALSVLLSFHVTFTLSLPQDSPSSNPTDDIPDGLSTVCGEIISYVDAGYSVFPAQVAHECLTSVPFHPAVALRFLDYYSTVLQFQSTVPYLANPPAGYQQPPIDVQAELERLKQRATAGKYRNQYEFEAELMGFVYSFHDGHVDLNQGILSAFTFASPLDITTASKDGKETPGVYLTDDLLQHREGYEIHPITQINGENATSFLTRFAAMNSRGTLEPHADWNQLMTNPVQFTLGQPSVFAGSATFYPGAELNFTFANDTTIDTQWLALYNEPQLTGPLATSGDFYNFFVLGLLPASCTADGQCPFNPLPPDLAQQARRGIRRQQVPPEDAPQDDEVSPGLFRDTLGAYPLSPDVIQAGLSVGEDRVMTGYFLRDISTAVLSIPTFNQVGQEVTDFSTTVNEFIEQAKGMSRVVIDLQANQGGTPLLAFDTFKKFFPDPDPQKPFAGSNRRVENLADVLGAAKSEYWSSLAEGEFEKTLLASNEWVVTNRINAETDETFSSWPEFAGPKLYNDTWKFSLTERYNLSDPEFSGAAFDGFFLDINQPSGGQPWPAEQIMILTDGKCASTCFLFVEMMNQAGVRTVVAGGQPTNGPMQAASGSRGARAYSSDFLYEDFAEASFYNATAAGILPQTADPGIFTIYAGFNLRNQIRESDDIPLHFQCLAADCRIYYTLDNAWNMTRLWQDAAAAMFDDPSLCVEGSRRYTSPIDSQEEVLAPPEAPPAPSNLYEFASANGVVFESDDIDGILATQANRPSGIFSPNCNNCRSGNCQTFPVLCLGAITHTFIDVCVERCTSQTFASTPLDSSQNAPRRRSPLVESDDDDDDDDDTPLSARQSRGGPRGGTFGFTPFGAPNRHNTAPRPTGAPVTYSPPAGLPQRTQPPLSQRVVRTGFCKPSQQQLQRFVACGMPGGPATLFGPNAGTPAAPFAQPVVPGQTAGQQFANPGVGAPVIA